MSDVLSANRWFTYTPVNNTQTPRHKAILCGSAGNIVVRNSIGGSTVTIAVLAGAVLPIEAASIDLTSTTVSPVILLK
jgi:hypothetical protein